MTSLRKDALWYKDAIIYELHLKAFKDKNNDGIGDINGLISKLDYLQDLGITAIWLLPFYPSPQRDGGYDISNYYDINPDYGTLEQLKFLLEEAHKRHLRVITELVINHTSDQHPWFQRARRSPEDSHFRNFYVWSSDPELYDDARIIFQDFESSNWTWDPIAKAYYWHRFYSHQPDLNYDNPDVQQEVLNIIDFWLDMGVDGFRLDAVPYLFERDGTNCENLPETHKFLKYLRSHIDKKYEAKVLLAEANMWPEDSVAYFGEGDECHMNYHFPIMPRMFMALKMENRYPIIDIIDQTPDIPHNCQWAIFLRNHDELTLEMVTDEERDYMHKAYGKDALSRINLGLRHRLAPLLDNDRQKIELMNVLLFSLPGTPVVYYGDEIGMGDNVYLGDRDGVRTPMQWSPDRNAGFSQANPHKLFLPLIMDPEYKYETLNVETQQKNPSSLLWWMKKMIDMRKRYRSFGRGDITFFDPTNNRILAFTRSYKNETILVIANLSRFPQSVQIDLSDYIGTVPIEVFSQHPFPVIDAQLYTFTIGRYGYFWFTLQKEITPFSSETESSSEAMIEVSKWEELFENDISKQLTSNLIRPYLTKAQWFGGHSRNIEEIQILESKFIAFSGGEAMICLLEISYHESLPEMYFLPLTYQLEDSSEANTIPAGGLGTVKLNQLTIWICDAVFMESFQVYLLRQMVNSGSQSANFIYLRKNSQAEQLAELTDPLNISVTDVADGYTLINYSSEINLKLYRKLDKAPNPDAEMHKFFAEEIQFPNILPFLGQIKYNDQKNHSYLIGTWVNAHSQYISAWEYFSDRVLKYFDKLILNDYDKDIYPLDLDEHWMFQNSNDWNPYFSLIGDATVNNVFQIGNLMGQFHKEMFFKTDGDGFGTEPFSLHYQRSLYSALKSLTRESFNSLNNHLHKMPETARSKAMQVLELKSNILTWLKRLYSHKIEAAKTRIHGNFHLEHILHTGKDFVISHFAGESYRMFSEQRLRKTPLRDVATMIRSFHYVAYTRLMFHKGVRVEDATTLFPWAETWYRICSSLFLEAYIKSVDGLDFIPANKDDLIFLLEAFLMERALYELKEELLHRPDWAIIPLKGIMSTFSILEEKNARPLNT